MEDNSKNLNMVSSSTIKDVSENSEFSERIEHKFAGEYGSDFIKSEHVDNCSNGMVSESSKMAEANAAFLR